MAPTGFPSRPTLHRVEPYWAIRGRYNLRRHATVANIARYWTAAVVVWLVGFATLYVAPRLT